jgi:hypothetical protein
MVVLILDLLDCVLRRFESLPSGVEIGFLREETGNVSAGRLFLQLASHQAIVVPSPRSSHDADETHERSLTARSTKRESTGSTSAKPAGAPKGVPAGALR